MAGQTAIDGWQPRRATATNRSCLLVPALHLIPHGLGTFVKASIVGVGDTLVVAYDDPMPDLDQLMTLIETGVAPR